MTRRQTSSGLGNAFIGGGAKGVVATRVEAEGVTWR